MVENGLPYDPRPVRDAWSLYIYASVSLGAWASSPAKSNESHPMLHTSACHGSAGVLACEKQRISSYTSCERLPRERRRPRLRNATYFIACRLFLQGIAFSLCAYLYSLTNTLLYAAFRRRGRLRSHDTQAGRPRSQVYTYVKMYKLQASLRDVGTRTLPAFILTMPG